MRDLRSNAGSTRRAPRRHAQIAVPSDLRSRSQIRSVYASTATMPCNKKADSSRFVRRHNGDDKAEMHYRRTPTTPEEVGQPRGDAIRADPATHAELG